MDSHIVEHFVKDYRASIEAANVTKHCGHVKEIVGMVIESQGPKASLGERCAIVADGEVKLEAEVIGFRDQRVVLMPFGRTSGIAVNSTVHSMGSNTTICLGPELLGRVLDPFLRPIDNLGVLPSTGVSMPVYREADNPLSRPTIDSILQTGVKAIDTLVTVGKGQRMGIFAGSGVGKSSLLGMIAKNLDADLNVIALIGERGREVREFIDHVLGEEALAKSVVIVATSDQPALVRTQAAWVATTIAEFFCSQGKHVVLTMDSLTRFAMAQREIGIAIGEPPTARGYTPSVFAQLPQLLERAGTHHSGGSITGFYTVLVEGDDMNEPLTDAARSVLDGGIVLSRALANERHYPAIDILQSNSRLFSQLATAKELGAAKTFVESYALYARARDMIDIGAYQAGSNKALDEVLKKLPAMHEFLQQDIDESMSRLSAMEALRACLHSR